MMARMFLELRRRWISERVSGTSSYLGFSLDWILWTACGQYLYDRSEGSPEVLI